MQVGNIVKSGLDENKNIESKYAGERRIKTSERGAKGNCESGGEGLDIKSVGLGLWAVTDGFCIVSCLSFCVLSLPCASLLGFVLCFVLFLVFLSFEGGGVGLCISRISGIKGGEHPGVKRDGRRRNERVEKEEEWERRRL